MRAALSLIKGWLTALTALLCDQASSRASRGKRRCAAASRSTGRASHTLPRRAAPSCERAASPWLRPRSCAGRTAAAPGRVGMTMALYSFEFVQLQSLSPSETFVSVTVDVCRGHASWVVQPRCCGGGCIARSALSAPKGARREARAAIRKAPRRTGSQLAASWSCLREQRMRSKTVMTIVKYYRNGQRPGFCQAQSLMSDAWAMQL